MTLDFRKDRRPRTERTAPHVYRPLPNEAGERRAVCLEVGGPVESPLPMNPASVVHKEWPHA